MSSGFGLMTLSLFECWLLKRLFRPYKQTFERHLLKGHQWHHLNILLKDQPRGLSGIMSRKFKQLPLMMNPRWIESRLRIYRRFSCRCRKILNKKELWTHCIYRQSPDIYSGCVLWGHGSSMVSEKQISQVVIKKMTSHYGRSTFSYWYLYRNRYSVCQVRNML